MASRSSRKQTNRYRNIFVLSVFINYLPYVPTHNISKDYLFFYELFYNFGMNTYLISSQSDKWQNRSSSEIFAPYYPYFIIRGDVNIKRLWSLIFTKMHRTFLVLVRTYLNT